MSVAKRGYVSKSDLLEAILSILYKLGICFPYHPSSRGRYCTGHFRKWCVNGEWKKVSGIILERHKYSLDMSSVDLDSSHTTALRGGECCGYQGRKKRNTTNAIYVTDRQGIPLAHVHPRFEFAQRPLQHLRGTSGTVLGA